MRGEGVRQVEKEEEREGGRTLPMNLASRSSLFCGSRPSRPLLLSGEERPHVTRTRSSHPLKLTSSPPTRTDPETRAHSQRRLARHAPAYSYCIRDQRATPTSSISGPSSTASVCAPAYPGPELRPSPTRRWSSRRRSHRQSP